MNIDPKADNERTRDEEAVSSDKIKRVAPMRAWRQLILVLMITTSRIANCLKLSIRKIMHIRISIL